jgi:hypothetical protein
MQAANITMMTRRAVKRRQRGKQYSWRSKYEENFEEISRKFRGNLRYPVSKQSQLKTNLNSNMDPLSVSDLCHVANAFLTTELMNEEYWANIDHAKLMSVLNQTGDLSALLSYFHANDKLEHLREVTKSPYTAPKPTSAEQALDLTKTVLIELVHFLATAGVEKGFKTPNIVLEDDELVQYQMDNFECLFEHYDLIWAVKPIPDLASIRERIKERKRKVRAEESGSSSSSLAPSRRVSVDMPPQKCHCGVAMRLQHVKKDGANQGRAFYACVTDKCRQFIWAD